MTAKAGWLVGSGFETLLAALCLLAFLGPPATCEESLPIKRQEARLLETASDFEALAALHGGIYSHPELNELVRTVGARLAPPSTDPYLDYRFHLLLSTHPSAFTMPDGQVYVTVGMLTLLENEAQLATLLAHEIGHAAGHHGIRRHRSRRNRGGFLRALWLGVGVALAADDWIEDDEALGFVIEPSQVSLERNFTQPAIHGYSRALEEETDAQAIRRVAESGYDVRQSARLYELLGRAPEGESETETKWSVHPKQLLDRAARLRRMASDLGSEIDLDALIVGAESYADLRWRVSLDVVHQYLLVEDPDRAVTAAEKLVDERQDDPEALFALAEARRAVAARRDLLGSATVPTSHTRQGPRLPPPDPTRGSIALRVRSKARSGFGPGMPAQEVLFVKLEEGDQGFTARRLIPSSHTGGKQVYLLNAKPGRYVAVAATLRGQQASHFFSMATISATPVTVVPQQMVFMGDFHLTRAASKRKKTDRAQAHYHQLLYPEAFTAAGRMLTLGLARVPTLDLETIANDPQTETEFWTIARDEVFAHDSRWQVWAARQLAAVPMAPSAGPAAAEEADRGPDDSGSEGG